MQEVKQEIDFQSFGEEKSQPTKQKVKTFKVRLFSLLVRYISKSKSVSALINALSENLFIREPQRTAHLIRILLQKQKINSPQIKQIRMYYKMMLTYKSSKVEHIFVLDYIKLLKNATVEDYAAEIQEMVAAFLCQRKCTLKNSFFLFLARKIPKVKIIIVSKCQEIKKTLNLRPAQLKQANLLIKKLSKKQQKVKLQTQ